MFAGRLAQYGRWTYRGAWALEIVAAIIGLTTGLALGYQAFNATETSDLMDLVLASAPFLMVALAELTKIPIATLLFVASWTWKPLLAIGLGALALITFETVFFGLERAVTLRQLAYSELEQEISEQQQDKQAIEADIARLENPASIGNLQETLDKLLGLRGAERDDIVSDLERIEKLISGSDNLPPRYRQLTSQLEAAEQALASFQTQVDAELTRRGEEFESQRESYIRRIEGAQSSDPERARRWEDELRRLKDPRPGIRAESASRIQELEAEISAVRRERDSIDLLVGNPNAERIEALQREMGETRSRLADVDRKWEPQIQGARDLLLKAQDSSSLESERLVGMRAQLGEVDRNIAGLQKDRVISARTDQVRRLAARLFGVHPEDVTTSQASMVGLIWFGSLAALAALAGPLTAMVALGLQSTADHRQSQRESRLSRFIRRWLVRWRFRRVRTVPKEVQVFVDREVEKRIEVPREVVTKEIVYVPLLTDDPAVVRDAMSSDLPPEIASLVQIRRARSQSESAT